MKRRDAGLATAEEAPEEQADKIGKKPESKYSVMSYIVVMFVFVVVIILFSYFIQQRSTAETISDLTEQHSDFSVAALQNIEKLQETNMELVKQTDDLKRTVEELEKKLEEAEDTHTVELRKQETELREEYDKLNLAHHALQYLYNARKALAAGDEEGAKTAILKMEGMRDYLGQFLEDYDAIFDELYKSGE